MRIIALLSAFALTPVLAVTSPGAVAHALNNNSGPNTRPTTWAPTQVFSKAENEGSNGSHVTFYMSWQGPASAQNLGGPRGGRATFELGWKDIRATNSCDTPSNVFIAGFPANQEVKWDYSEDPFDTILWMADMDVLAQDIRARPNKQYSAKARCGSRGGYFQPDGRPYLEVQQGQWTRNVKDPISTFSEATLHNIPAEQGAKAFPVGGYPDREPTWAYMFNAWNRDHSMEDNDPAWRGFDANPKQYCTGTPFSGRCYKYILPDRLGTSRSSWFYQGFHVTTLSNKANTRFETGTRTNQQVQLGFRCPSNAPAQAGASVSGCPITMWLRTRGSEWQTRSFRVPSDDRWYYALVDDLKATASGDTLDIWFQTNGVPVDVDDVWVQSGL